MSIITNRVISNAFVGFLFFGLFTVLIDNYENNPNYLKMSTFLWSAPLFFLFMLYIMRSKEKDVMISFTKHAALGTLASITIFLTTIMISNLSFKLIMAIDSLLVITMLYTYFCFKLYKL